MCLSACANYELTAVLYPWERALVHVAELPSSAVKIEKQTSYIRLQQVGCDVRPHPDLPLFSGTQTSEATAIDTPMYEPRQPKQSPRFLSVCPENATLSNRNALAAQGKCMHGCSVTNANAHKQARTQGAIWGNCRACFLVASTE